MNFVFNSQLRRWLQSVFAPMNIKIVMAELRTEKYIRRSLCKMSIIFPLILTEVVMFRPV